ncbi:MAG: YebC/PmpR family DNA-binding transcriptional regulator, partial [Christensenellales bacterium]
GVYEIYPLPQDVNSVKEELEKGGLGILSFEVGFYPDDYVTPQPEAIPMIEKLIGMLEENDDVQNVYHNADLPEDEEED